MINPQLDFSWVPPELTAFVNMMLGTFIVMLVIGLMVACVWLIASKVSGNFFIENGRAGIAILCTLMAATCLASLPAGLTWGDSLNTIGSGITLNADAASSDTANSPLAGEIGSAAARSAAGAQAQGAQAKKNMRDAGKRLKSGDIMGAVGSAAKAVGNAAKGVTDTVTAGVQTASHMGVVGTLKLGWTAIGQQVSSWWSSLSGH